MGNRELVALLKLSSWCLVVVGWLFLTVPRGCLRFVIVVFPDHTLLLFLLLVQKIIVNKKIIHILKTILSCSLSIQLRSATGLY